MKYKSKGQGAMEYLMTYGWAILVVMIIGIAIYYLGIFNISGTTAKSFSGFSEIKPIDWILTPTGGFLGTFVNAAGTEVKVTGINITNSDGSSCFRNLSYDVLYYPSYPSNKEFGLLGPVGDCTSGSAVAGDKYKIKVRIEYLKSIGGTNIAHSSVGFINGAYENTCIEVCQAHLVTGILTCNAIGYTCSSSSCALGCSDGPAAFGSCGCTAVCCPP